MTKRDRAELGRYIRWVADAIGLRDWELDLMLEPAEEGHVAEVDPTFGRRHAELRFCAKFRERDPEAQRNAVVHELVHCHLAPLQSQVEDDLDQLLGKPADLVFSLAFRRNLEYSVDALAEAIAEHMPLIAWPK